MASPTPSNMPPPNLKRPRTSNAYVPTVNAQPRAKRRKPEDIAQESVNGRGGQLNFGVGMVKGREDEFGEPADVQTKVSLSVPLIWDITHLRDEAEDRVDRLQHPTFGDAV